LHETFGKVTVCLRVSGADRAGSYSPCCYPHRSTEGDNLLRVVFLTFVAIVCVSFAAVSAQASPTAKVIKLVAVQASQKQTADGFVIKDNDFVGGKKVGRDTLTCVATQRQAKCRVLFELPAGTIKVNVVLVFSKSQGQGTITGGTGEYAGAKGRLTYRNLNQQGTRTALVLTLT
jgi:hypothetical protein